MAELTDAQKVMRNDTGKSIAEAIANMSITVAGQEIEVSDTEPQSKFVDVWFQEQQQGTPVEVYTVPEINDMIAPAETSPTQAAHHVGEYIICVLNGQAKLYKVIAEISTQETLTVGGNIEEISITDILPKILYYSGGPVSVSAGTVTWFDAGFTLPKGDYLVFASVIPQSTVPSATGQCRIQYSINGSSGVEAINKTGLGNGNGIQGFAYTNNYFRIGTYLTGTTDAVYFTYNAYILKIK